MDRDGSASMTYHLTEQVNKHNVTTSGESNTRPHHRPAVHRTHLYSEEWKPFEWFEPWDDFTYRNKQVGRPAHLPLLSSLVMKNKLSFWSLCSLTPVVLVFVQISAYLYLHATPKHKYTVYIKHCWLITFYRYRSVERIVYDDSPDTSKRCLCGKVQSSY